MVKNDDVVVATHGRAFWILDDISPLRQMSAENAAKDAHLFAPATAIRTRGGGGFGGGAATAGQNPPNGAFLYYNLKSVPEGEITIEILDAKGATVRKFSSRAPDAAEGQQPAGPFGGQAAPRVPKEKGLNRFVWNLRYEDASRVQPLILWAGGVQGPLAVPGAYQVKLTAGGKSQTVPLDVRPDPRVQTSQADLQKQFDLLMQIRAKVTETHDAINQLRDVRTQIQALRKRHADNAKAKDLLAQAEALEKKLDPIEESLIQRKASSGQDLLNWPIMLNNKLTALAGIVESADTAPTEQSYEVFKYLVGQIDPVLAKWREVKEKDVPALNAAARRIELPAVQVTAPKP